MSAGKPRRVVKKKKSAGFIQKFFNIFKSNSDDVAQYGTVGSEDPIKKNPIKIESQVIEGLNRQAANAEVLKVDTEATYLPLHDLISLLIQQNLNKKRLNKGLLSSILPAEEVNFAVQQAFELKYGVKNKRQLANDQSMDNTPENDKQPSNRKTTKPRL